MAASTQHSRAPERSQPGASIHPSNTKQGFKELPCLVVVRSLNFCSNKEYLYNVVYLKKKRQYRQWAIRKFNLWDTELEFINSLLDVDIRNNSAWNQRYFLISNTNELNASMSAEVLNKEIAFCLEKIDKCVDNESSWNYLRGLVTHLCSISTSESACSAYPDKVVEFCMNKARSEREDHKSPFLTAFLVDYNFLKAKDLLKLDKADNETLKSLVTTSIEMLESLARKYDVIRVNYWNYLISKWQKEFAQFV